MMTRILVSLLGVALTMSVITLFPPSVAWSTQIADVEKLLASADAKRGEPLSEICADCHGQNGYSKEPNKPNLAGQLAPYLLKQLLDYKSKERPEKTMMKQIKRLNQQDLADLATYFSSLPTSSQAKLCSDPPDVITKGDPSRNMNACVSCHGAQAQGVPPAFPRLVGQKPGYIIEELNEFRANARFNDPGHIMVRTLKDDEIKAVAECFAAGSQ